MGLERPPVSGSMAGHCRMELWLAGHGYQGETSQPSAQRTFDLGHIIEATMFRGVELHDGSKSIPVGPWWPNLGEVKDFATGQSFDASKATVRDFQREVSFAGYSGHIDGILDLDTGSYVLDCKSTQGFGYDRNLTSDLLQDPFGREYVCQLHFYAQGLRDAGEKIAGGVLLYFNKEQSNVMCRFVPFSEEVIAEVRERLSWASNAAEPEPDWTWASTQPVPLRCGYCNQRGNCAQVRGQKLRLEITTNKKGTSKPQWIVE